MHLTTLVDAEGTSVLSPDVGFDWILDSPQYLQYMLLTPSGFVQFQANEITPRSTPATAYYSYS